MTVGLPPFPTPTDAVRALSDRIAERLGSALTVRRTASLVLSGGSTPVALFRDLVARHRGSLPWADVDVFWADERAVGPDDPDSNYRSARAALLDPLGAPEARRHRIRGEARPIDGEAERYEREIRDRFAGAAGPWWDVTILGMGPDGHTASLFPGARSLDAPTDRLVLVEDTPTQDPKIPRITLTLGALARSAYTAFLVVGAEKAPALARVRESTGGSTPLPAARVRAAGPIEWFIDRAASGPG